MSRELTNQQKIAELWRRGVLHWKLHAVQKEIYDAIHSCGQKLFVVNSSRRLGKSWTLCVLALEQALRQPNSQIKFAAPSQKMVRKIIAPLMKQILENCPKHLRPRFKTIDGEYEFPNGSVISVAGSEQGQIDNLRGTACDLALVDEAGFVSELNYLIDSVLMPQLLTRPGAKIILASTPPPSPDHPFLGYAQRAQTSGAYMQRTIFDNPLLTEQQVLEFAEEAGCVVDWEQRKLAQDNTTWRREYMCVEGSTLVTVRTPSGEIKTMTIRELKDELSEAV